MTGPNNQFDFDFIVIGSGFGGSVSAHRLVEKGYRVAVMEMGRRWNSKQPAAHQLVDPSLFLASPPWPARLFQHAVLQARDHLPWLRGGWRIDHLRKHFACSFRKSLGSGNLGGTGRLENGNAPALRNRGADVRCDGKQNPRTRRPSIEERLPKLRAVEILSTVRTWASSSPQPERPVIKPFPIHSSEVTVQREPPALPAVAA